MRRRENVNSATSNSSGFLSSSSTSLAWVLALLFTLTALLVGVVGYRFLEGLTWIDSFLNAANILAGMGPVSPLKNFSAKLFAGIYALFSGLVFIAWVSIVLSNSLHILVQRFGIDLPAPHLRRRNRRV